MNTKKIIRVLVVLIIIIFLLLVAGVVFLYKFAPGASKREWSNGTELNSEQWTGSINDKNNKCYLTSWKWDGDTENMEIVIPNEIDGVQVVALGGWDFGYAEPFYIDMPEEYQIDNSADLAWVAEEDSIAADYPQDFPVFQFKVKLNDTITDTSGCQEKIYYSTTNGDAIAYKIEMTFE